MFKDLFFIIFIISIVVGIIYMIYNLMSFSSFGKNKADLQVTEEDILSQMKILYKQKKYNIVEYLAKKYLSRRPSSHEVRYVYAKALFRVRRFYDAIDQARIIIKYQSENIESRIFVSKCYKETNQQLKAINELKDLLNHDQFNLYALRDLAILYNQTNQKISAIRAYRQLEEHYIDTTEVILIKTAIAQIYMELSQFVNAVNEYKALLVLYPEEVHIKKLLAIAYIQNIQYTFALELLTALQKSELEDKDSLWVLESLVNIKMSLGKYQEAFDDVKILLEHPLTEKKKIKAILAKIMLAVGQIDESIELLNQLIELDETDIDLKKSLANSFLAKRDFTTAIGIYKKIINDSNILTLDMTELNHEMSNIYGDWATWYFDHDNSSKCFDTFALALQYDSENADIYYKMAKINLTIKSYNEATINCKKAIERDSKNPNYYLVLAKCYSYLDNVLDERKALMQAIEYNYDNPSAHYRLAIINEGQRDIANAVAHMKMAIELDENFLEAKYKLALLLELQGRVEEAVFVYQNLLEKHPGHEPSINNLRMLKKELN